MAGYLRSICECRDQGNPDNNTLSYHTIAEIGPSGTIGGYLAETLLQSLE